MQSRFPLKIVTTVGSKSFEIRESRSGVQVAVNTESSFPADLTLAASSYAQLQRLRALASSKLPSFHTPLQPGDPQGSPHFWPAGRKFGRFLNNRPITGVIPRCKGYLTGRNLEKGAPTFFIQQSETIKKQAWALELKHLQNVTCVIVQDSCSLVCFTHIKKGS